jgi:hypothetical protein
MMMCERAPARVHVSGGKRSERKLSLPMRCGCMIVQGHRALTPSKRAKGHCSVSGNGRSRFFDIARFCVMWRIDGRNVGPMHRITEK